MRVFHQNKRDVFPRRLLAALLTLTLLASAFPALAAEHVMPDEEAAARMRHADFLLIQAIREM